MRIINLAINDLLQIVRDWKSFLFLLFMPVVFTLIFGFAFGGFEADSEDEAADHRLPVGLVDRDAGQLSPTILAIFEKSETIRPVTFENPDVAEIEAMVAENELAALVIVPSGYSEQFLATENPQLISILKNETSAGATAQNSIQAVVGRIQNALGAAQFSVLVQEQQNLIDSEAQRQEIFNRSLETAVAAWDEPPFTLVSTHTGMDAESDESAVNAFAHSSPGMMVQFAIAGLIGAASVLVNERKSGSLQRLLTTAISRNEILIGHFLAMFIMILLQFTILISFAAILLKVGYFAAPFATIIITLTTTFFVASMGMLIGTLSKTEEQAIMFSLIPMFILSGLGGAWVPLELTSKAFQTVGHFTPVAWAMDGYQNIVMRGMGVEGVLIPSAVLIGFGVVCFGLAAWRFKFE
jgi:ABC-2 type transport system permease protein